MTAWQPRWSGPQNLALSEVEVASRLVVREPRAATVRDYAQAMRAGVVFTPIDAARIGARLYLVDGMHRMQAAHAAGLAVIPARVAKMTWAQAGAYAAKANIGHGRPLSGNKEKAKALELFLQDPASATLSSREVSQALGGLVSHVTVTAYRKKTRGKLRGSDVLEGDETEAAAEEARERRMVEQALRHLEGLEAVFGRMSDPGKRHEVLEALKDTAERMGATGNAQPSQARLDAAVLGV